MKKVLLIIILTCSIISLSYKIHDLKEIFNSDDLFYTTIKKLHYDLVDVPILEANDLNEFTSLTKFPYSYYNGAMIEKNGKSLIITIPIRYFKNKDSFKKTVKHELFHFYFNNNTSLNAYEQEGIILKLLKNDNIKDYIEFQKMNYEKIIEYIKKKKLN